MLVSSLKLRGHKKLDPIFVGVCGVASSILNFLKAFYEKRIILNLDKKPDDIIGEDIISLSKIGNASPLKSMIGSLIDMTHKKEP